MSEPADNLNTIRHLACHVLGRLDERLSRTDIDDALGVTPGGPYTDLGAACRKLLDAMEVRVVRGADDYLEFRDAVPVIRGANG